MTDLALDSWASSPVALITAAVFGALWGSFFNVCIARIPRGESVVRPASHCFSCGALVRPWDNIPILSYFLLRGRCRRCGAHFSVRYALVEALTALLSALVYWRFVYTAPDVAPGLRAARYALYFAFVGVLVVLSFIDLDTQWLPDVITLPSIAVFFLGAFGAQDVVWWSRAIGAAVGFVVVVVISEGYYYATGREGLGWGDGKLLAVVGAVLGWHAIPLVIFMGSFLGIVVSVPLLLLHARKASPAPPQDPAAEKAPALQHTPVPFGPFLSLSAVVYLMFGERLWSWLVARVAGY